MRLYCSNEREIEFALEVGLKSFPTLFIRKINAVAEEDLKLLKWRIELMKSN